MSNSPKEKQQRTRQEIESALLDWVYNYPDRLAYLLLEFSVTRLTHPDFPPNHETHYDVETVMILSRCIKDLAPVNPYKI